MPLLGLPSFLTMHPSSLRFSSRFHKKDIWPTLLLHAIRAIESSPTIRPVALRPVALRRARVTSPFAPTHRTSALHNPLLPFLFSYRPLIFTASSTLYRFHHPPHRTYATTSSINPNSTPFEVLNLPPTATQQDLKRRYYELVKQLHPDKVGDNTTETRARFDRVVKAYELLSDQGRRHAYVRFGIGWDSKPSTASSQGATSHPSGHRPATYANAYWYDDPTYQGPFAEKPRFTSNPIFASLVAAAAVIVVFIQLCVFEASHMTLRSAADRHHAKSSEDLKRAREDARLFGREHAIERIYDSNMRHQRKKAGMVEVEREKPVTAREWAETWSLKKPVVVETEKDRIEQEATVGLN